MKNSAGTLQARRIAFLPINPYQLIAIHWLMLASKSAFSLGVAIAVLSGCLVFTVPVHAAKILTVPSGLEQPSPLFGVKPFSTPVVLFEEFGLQDYKDSSGNPKEDLSKTTLPRPIDPSTNQVDCTGNHDDGGIDSIIRHKELYPLPGQFAHNEMDADGKFIYANPWAEDIKTCDPATANMDMPMDGRPGARTSSISAGTSSVHRSFSSPSRPALAPAEAHAINSSPMAMPTRLIKTATSLSGANSGRAAFTTTP